MNRRRRSPSKREGERAGGSMREEDDVRLRGIGIGLFGAAVVALAATAGASAKKNKTFVFDEVGLELTWSRGAGLELTRPGDDVLIEGSRGGVRLKVVIRPGERLPEVQHEYRLMSYFPGEWTKTPDACRGVGWDGCSSWSHVAEGTGDRGLGMVGYGPGGTYMVVLSASEKRFRDLRPTMRSVQQSVILH